MWAMEASEVFLVDRLQLQVDEHGYATAPVAPLLMDMCEAGSIAPLSVVASRGQGAAARVEGATAHVKAAPNAHVALWLAGIRKGMKGRFLQLSEERARKNNEFWNTPWR